MKPLIQAPPVSASVSWWINSDQKEFTKRCEAQLPKMVQGPSGKGRGRPISTDELSR